MKNYTITVIATNEIIKNVYCDSDRISAYLETGQQSHLGKFEANKFTFDGTSFNEKTTHDELPFFARSTTEIATTMFKQLYAEGISIPEHEGGCLDTKEQAKYMIDLAANRALLKFVSRGLFVTHGYQRVEQQSRWLLDNPTGVVPPMVQTVSDVNGLTALEAAQFIVDTADSWYTAIETVYDKRLKGKKAVDDADLTTFKSIATTKIAELNNYGLT